jgi:hypothetical protein
MQTPATVLKDLVRILPGFAPAWESPGNCFLDDDGSFTYHGLFSELGHYVRDNFEEIEEREREELFGFIESCVSNDTQSEDELDNAVCTCFLENVASEPLPPELRKYMGRKSLTFFNEWDNPVAGAAT